MALKTRSVFYYGHTITLTNKYLDINEGTGVISVEIPEGSYTPTKFCSVVSTAVNAVATNTWSFTFNRTNRTITITVNVASSILGSTGPNVANSVMNLLGLGLNDYGPFNSLTSGPSGYEYSPQFLLQSYLPSSHTKKLVSSVVTKSASGKSVTVQSFGEQRMVKFNITYITNIVQPIGSVIASSPSGVEDAVAFLEYATSKSPIEAMYDGGDRLTFESIMLETTQADSSGVGFEMIELYDRGLPYYYETGLLVWVVVD